MRLIDGRPGRYIGRMIKVVCCLCGTEKRLKNMNQEAAVREAERAGWRQIGEHGPACPECIKAATGKDPRDEEVQT